MKYTKTWIFTILLTLLVLLAACQPEQVSPTTVAEIEAPTSDPSLVETSVAQTVEAELTQVAAANPTNTPNPPRPTSQRQLKPQPKSYPQPQQASPRLHPKGHWLTMLALSRTFPSPMEP
ncbi:MAG: hypothetical protein HC806_00715 [Anaerolineae bacterium]|nr:hypothetical protein [Anaerolineae bacterium]